MARLSPIPAERQLQLHVVLLIGCATVAFVLGRFGVVDLDLLRAVLGAAFALVALRLPLLVRRHRARLADVRGLKRQYTLAGGVTVVYGLVGLAFLWWGGVAAAVIGLVSIGLTQQVRTVPVEQMTQSIDYDDPGAWQTRSPRLMESRPVLFWTLAIVVPVVLVFGGAWVAFLLSGAGD